MRTIALFAAVLVVASTAGCVRVHRDPATGNADVDVESPLKRGEDWSGTVTGRDMHLSASGTVRAVIEGDNTVTTIVLTGLQPRGRHPWHLHEGTCATGGPIFGDPNAYAPLTVGDDGRAEGSARLVNLKLNEARKYHANVHASQSNMGTIIACGDVTD
jgi:hypothetical protein